MKEGYYSIQHCKYLNPTKNEIIRDVESYLDCTNKSFIIKLVRHV